MKTVININDYKQKKIKKEKEIEEKMIQQEYDAFISLLKIVVNSTTSKIDVVRIRPFEGKYIFYDDNCEELQNDELDKEFKTLIDTGDISYDDFLVTSLISLSPKKIIIYNSEQISKELKTTIKNVFMHKVTFKEKEDLNVGKVYNITSK